MGHLVVKITYILTARVPERQCLFPRTVIATLTHEDYNSEQLLIKGDIYFDIKVPDIKWDQLMRVHGVIFVLITTALSQGERRQLNILFWMSSVCLVAI